MVRWADYSVIHHPCFPQRYSCMWTDSLVPDINECLSGGAGSNCSGGCENTLGSYRCNCPTGATLDSDGISCRGNKVEFVQEF